MSNLMMVQDSPLLVGVTDKDAKSRIGQFEAWLKTSGQPWYTPDLAAYRDTLLERLASATVAAHLASIRGRYTALLADNRVRDGLFALTPADARRATARRCRV